MPLVFVLATLARLAAGLVAAPPPTFAYLHIPFCRRRCFYCDFPVHVVGDQGPSGSATEAYGNPILLRS